MSVSYLERLSVTLCFAWNAPPLSAGMDPFGTHRIKPDFSSIHWKAGSRLFRCCKCERRPPPPKGNEREKRKHTRAGWTLRASCEGWGFLLHLLPTGMGWAGVGDISWAPGGALSLSPLLCTSSSCSLTHPKYFLGVGSGSRAASPTLQRSGRGEGGSRMWAHFLPQMSHCLLWLCLHLALVLQL